MSYKLFIDLCIYRNTKDLSEAKYTTKLQDQVYKGKTYPSLYKLYMEEADESEYFFAKKYFESWQQWEKLCNSAALKSKIDTWREELQIKLKAEELLRVKEAAASGDVQSSKWLLDKHWQSSVKPTTKLVKGKVKEVAEERTRNVTHQEFDKILQNFEKLTTTCDDKKKTPVQ